MYIHWRCLLAPVEKHFSTSPRSNPVLATAVPALHTYSTRRFFLCSSKIVSKSWNGRGARPAGHTSEASARNATHPEPRSQDGDGHLLAAALVHQSSNDDVGVGVHVSLDDARRGVHLFIGRRGEARPASHDTSSKIVAGMYVRTYAPAKRATGVPFLPTTKLPSCVLRRRSTDRRRGAGTPIV